MSIEKRRVRRNLPGRGRNSYSTQRRDSQASLPPSRPNSADPEDSGRMVQPGHHHSYQPAPPPRPPSARSISRRASQCRPPSRESTSYNLYESGLEQRISRDDPSRDAYSRASFVDVSRPSSSLSKYNPLPPIGHRRRSQQFETDIGDSTTELANSVQKIKVSVHVPSSEDSRSTNQRESPKGGNPLRHDTSQKTSLSRHSSKTNGSGEITGSKSLDKNERLQGKTGSIDIQLQDSKPESSSLVQSEKGQLELSLAIKLPDGQRLQHSFPATCSMLSVLQFAERESGLNFDGFSFIQNSPKRVFSDLSKTLQECDLEDRTLLYVDMGD